MHSGMRVSSGAIVRNNLVINNVGDGIVIQSPTSGGSVTNGNGILSLFLLTI